MKVKFEYSREKDIWCLLTYGKNSLNRGSETEIYKELVAEFGDNTGEQNASLFIDNYFKKRNINIDNYVSTYQNTWDNFSKEYEEIAEKVFKVEIPNQIHSNITINTVCPYDIRSNMFFVSLQTKSIERAVIHELWHFYTWYKFGDEWIKKLGNKKYNDIKESLTELINIECAGLLPDGIRDNGYPQHKEMREKISKTWNEVKDIDKLWEQLV